MLKGACESDSDTFKCHSGQVFRTLDGATKYSSEAAMRVQTVGRASAWTIGALALAAVLPLPGDAAQSAKPASAVKGEFAFVSTEQCAYATSFGPPPVLQASGTVMLQMSTLQGTLTLAADGTGRLTGRIVSIQSIPDAGATPAMQSSLSCDVTHTLTATGEVRLDRACHGTRVRGTGSESAQTWTASPVHESGQFSPEQLVLADTQLGVESLAVAGVTFRRVCQHTSWLTRRK
jgi:hypothetical protein